MKITFLVAALSLVSARLFAQDAIYDTGIYAEFNTSKGTIVCVLEHQKTP